MEDQSKKPVQEEVTPEQQIKDLMNKIKSAITVYTHTHDGKAPESIEEIAQMLEADESVEKSDEMEDDAPKVLSFLIHYGKDPSKPAFYEDTKSSLYFDPSAGSWRDTKPELLDHLQSREVESEDLFDMILHGVMDDSDYSKLNELGMMDKKCCMLYDKIRSMQTQASELEKSEEEPKDELASDQKSQPGGSDMTPPEQETQPEGSDMTPSPEMEEMRGTDVASEIMYWAQAPANSKEQEAMIRSIVERVLAEKGL